MAAFVGYLVAFEITYIKGMPFLKVAALSWIEIDKPSTGR